MLYEYSNLDISNDRIQISLTCKIIERHHHSTSHTITFQSTGQEWCHQRVGRYLMVDLTILSPSILKWLRIITWSLCQKCFALKAVKNKQMITNALNLSNCSILELEIV